MHRTHTQSRFRNDDGQALVEFALVLPLVLALLFGIIEFGRAYNYWVDQTHLANQAARFAAVNHRPVSGQTITQYTKDQGSTSELRDGTGQVGPGLKVCLTTSGVVGDPVIATATSTYHWLSILGVSAVTSTISADARMRVESAPTTYSSGECSS